MCVLSPPMWGLHTFFGSSMNREKMKLLLWIRRKRASSTIYIHLKYIYHTTYILSTFFKDWSRRHLPNEHSLLYIHSYFLPKNLQNHRKVSIWPYDLSTLSKGLLIFIGKKPFQLQEIQLPFRLLSRIQKNCQDNLRN